VKNHLVELPISTRDGQFIARYSEKGLAELDFPNGRADLPGSPDARQCVPAKISHWHRMTESALNRILAGKAPEEFPPLDAEGTDFQKKVWAALRKIAFGKTKSYGEIAETIGKPKAVRAVGGACGANPIPVLVPCHRVLAAHGKIGGFGGGLDWKRKLLAREGIKI
jgi:AraC family transcriptional regulator, regulatory protein of adaptative response / methylated-DNA-[protein]-cysteine methyltransferase